MPEIVDALTGLRDALANSSSLGLGDEPEAERTADELRGQLDDYVIPRLRRLDAPLLVVLGGSTGSGKSTITNSLVGESVSAAGVLRPSTRTPVLVARTDDRTWFLGPGILPDVPRLTGSAPTGPGLHVVTSDQLPERLALLDTPDIDSVEQSNHALAAQLLGAADVWLFVTTAARYADAVPWEYLDRARERSVALAIVINRIPPGAESEVGDHLTELLDRRGLGGVLVFPIRERPDVSADAGLLDDDDVDAVLAWLGSLVATDGERLSIIRSTIDGVLDSVPRRVTAVIDALDRRQHLVTELDAASRRIHRDELKAIDRELATGTILRGEVLDRWREHVGTGTFMAKLQQGVGRARARLRAAITRTRVDLDEARGQLESNLETLIHNHADRAAVETVTAWETMPGGPTVLAAADRGIDRPSADLAGRVRAQIAQWQQAVLELVASQAGNKIAVARMLSLGVNGAGLALMVAVFAQTGGVSGAEAGVAAGTAAVGQAVLTAIFGDNAVRDLIKSARDDLRRRLVAEFDTERSRFDRLLQPFHTTDRRVALARALDDVRAAKR